MKQLIDTLLTPFIEDSKRMLKIRSLSMALQAVKGARGLIFASFMGLAFCLVFVGSFFLTGIRLFQLVDQGNVGWDPVFLFGLITFVVCGLIMMIAFSEKTWLKASGLDKKVEEVTRRPAYPGPDVAGSEAEAMITHALDQLVEERLQERMKAHSADQTERAAREGVGRQSFDEASKEAHEAVAKERAEALAHEQGAAEKHHAAGSESESANKRRQREGKDSMREAL